MEQDNSESESIASAQDDRDSGSIAADHERSAVLRRAVSPTTHDTWRNTFRPIIKPVACWRLHAPDFRFDSSAILPEIGPELAKLKPLINDDRLATIFGHADPVGTIEYNAHLSARRARALFGLLTRNADIWLDLFADKQPHDQWGLASTQMMLAALTGQDGNPYYAGRVDGTFGPQTDNAIRTFQGEERAEDTNKPLAVDGIAGPATRKRLYQRYIDDLTGTPGEPLMKPDQFLGDANDNANPKGKGKGAFQGCSEYNPILLFSDEDEKEYAKQQDKTERNARNAPNRRAMIFFFSKKALLPLTPKEVATAWPCPAWNEGAAKCMAQLWPDHKERLKLGDKERKYAAGERTMACAWYDRFARLSPCEGTIVQMGDLLEPRPSIYIDKTPNDANLVIYLLLPSDDAKVTSLTLAGQTLVEGEQYFQYRSGLYFATASTGADTLDGVLTVSGPPRAEHRFRIHRATTLAERCDSLSDQMENAVQLARAAATKAADDGKSNEDVTILRAELLNDAFHRHIRIVESIESQLVTDEDNSYLHERQRNLPVMLSLAEES